MAIIRTTDPAEAARHVAEGGRLRRVAHDLGRELTGLGAGLGALGGGLRVGPLGDLEAAARASEASTPPGHPDHEAWPDWESRRRYWERLLVGAVCGDVLDAVVVEEGAEVVGGIVVTRMAANAWWEGGAWVAEVFVVPGWQGRGLGSWLLGRAGERGRAAGLGRVGLTVTEGNPAEGFYARLGFRRLRTVWVVERE